MKYTLKIMDTKGEFREAEVFAETVKALENEIERIEMDGSVVYKMVREDGREFHKIVVTTAK